MSRAGPSEPCRRLACDRRWARSVLRDPGQRSYLIWAIVRAELSNRSEIIRMKKQLPSASILSLLCASSIISCSIEDLEQDPASGAVGETAIHPVFQTFPATITALSPKPKPCLLRNSSLVAERTLTLTGIGFPFPRQTENIQFRREDTGAESIHFGLEVVWSSSTQISVDIARIASLLWSDP